MLAVAVIDYRTQKIPDICTLIIAVCGMGLRMNDHVFPLAAALIGGGVFAAQWIVSRGAWIGTGDILLGIALGIFLGTWPLALLMLWFAYVIGALVIAVQLPFHYLTRQKQIPFGPFIILGAVIAFFFGDVIIRFAVS